MNIVDGVIVVQANFGLTGLLSKEVFNANLVFLFSKKSYMLINPQINKKNVRNLCYFVKLIPLSTAVL